MENDGERTSKPAPLESLLLHSYYLEAVQSSLN